MSEAQQSEIPAPPELSFRMRVLFFFGDPLFAIGLLVASILTVIVGTAAGRWYFALCGIALAISAIGLLFLMLLMSLETLNGWAQQILRNVAALHDTEMRNLADQKQSSTLKLGSLLRN